MLEPDVLCDGEVVVHLMVRSARSRAAPAIPAVEYTMPSACSSWASLVQPGDGDVSRSLLAAT